MTTTTYPLDLKTQTNSWLKSYYATRAFFSILWVAAAFTLGKDSLTTASVLLVIYPLWDAVANAVDAHKNGGFKLNPPQTFNVFVSVLTALAVAGAMTISMNAVLGVFGVWASFSGILQLAAGVKRWKTSGAQWAMVLSGAQSGLAGVFMLHQAASPITPSITDVAPYAAFGAFYFLVSAIHLTISERRTKSS